MGRGENREKGNEEGEEERGRRDGIERLGRGEWGGYNNT